MGTTWSPAYNYILQDGGSNSWNLSATWCLLHQPDPERLGGIINSKNAGIGPLIPPLAELGCLLSLCLVSLLPSQVSMRKNNFISPSVVRVQGIVGSYFQPCPWGQSPWGMVKPLIEGAWVSGEPCGQSPATPRSYLFRLLHERNKRLPYWSHYCFDLCQPNHYPN